MHKDVQHLLGSEIRAAQQELAPHSPGPTRYDSDTPFTFKGMYRKPYNDELPSSNEGEMLND
ncbi:hypothetical protein HYZ97_02525 [Candidatus Pacearchaeota archaeon]|nr:hypothetical protein [Candidatus Pacearchaeota archaeon]